jgi:hypothetical protein
MHASAVVVRDAQKLARGGISPKLRADRTSASPLSIIPAAISSTSVVAGFIVLSFSACLFGRTPQT